MVFFLFIINVFSFIEFVSAAPSTGASSSRGVFSCKATIDGKYFEIVRYSNGGNSGEPVMCLDGKKIYSSLSRPKKENSAWNLEFERTTDLSDFNFYHLKATSGVIYIKKTKAIYNVEELIHNTGPNGRETKKQSLGKKEFVCTQFYGTYEASKIIFNMSPKPSCLTDKEWTHGQRTSLEQLQAAGKIYDYPIELMNSETPPSPKDINNAAPANSNSTQ